MGIFEKRQSIPRTELREILKKHSGRIPGTGGKKYFRQEREKMFKERMRPEYGSEISKDEYRRAVRDLKSAKLRAKTDQERRKIEQEFRCWKEVGGKNI